MTSLGTPFQRRDLARGAFGRQIFLLFITAKGESRDVFVLIGVNLFVASRTNLLYDLSLSLSRRSKRETSPQHLFSVSSHMSLDGGEQDQGKPSLL